MTPFEQDILEGLSANPKKLSSKYFYDAQGDKLFQEIMHMPEYYLTDCELEIFTAQKQAILEHMPAHFDLVELGAGDGTKTRILLKHFLEQGRNFNYLPIDISGSVLESLQSSLAKDLPQLEVVPKKGEYFKVLRAIKGLDKRPKVVLFLGANIGNLIPENAQRFLSELRDSLNPGDLLLIGFDLKKDPKVILDAYNDPAGITARFNLNLLKRLNRELGADFNPDQFKHWESYNPQSGETRSFIVSKKKQEVFIKALKRSFHFQAWESIAVELSLKYSLEEIKQLAQKCQFKQQAAFMDSRRYFVDVLWEKN
ncbi:MAG: L-histidine N(alpha)-methyltransferase [Bacteroidetes bacterium]|nr:L-histidine N(alpha)-methyltransferase [Bacteroidota bacterium]